MSKNKKHKSTVGKVAAISPPTREFELYDCLEGITQVTNGEQKFLLDPEYLKFRRELKDKSLLFINL